METFLAHLHRGSRQRWYVWTASLALVLGAGATQARAQSPAGDYTLVARHSGKCLDVAGGSVDAATVVQWTCSGGDSQAWNIEAVDSGYYRITDRQSGRALDVSAGATNNLTALVPNPTPTGKGQQWWLVPVTGGYFNLLARNGGKALDVSGMSVENGAAIVQSALDQRDSQQWLLRPVTAQSTITQADVVRFLEQATFGPTPGLVAHVQDVGFAGYLNEQISAPISSYPSLPLYPSTRDVVACPDGSTCQRDNYTHYLLQNQFFTNALYGPDQLRQRVAFALHQIIVVSGVDINLPSWMSPYLQLLDRNAFGNFRQLLYDVTLNPAMGNYLDINNNTKTRPNENYAREVLQLFSIGTVMLNLDGSTQLDGAGQPIPSYDQTTVDNFARVFTGWRQATAPATGVPNYRDPMTVNEAQHDTDQKLLLNGVVLAKGQNTKRDLDDAIDNIFHHQNVGPFISRQLIQHLVTSNPSPAYVAAVASVFNSNESGVRGDLASVVKAILLNPEARGAAKTDANYGRLRHPAQFAANLLRAFGARSANLVDASDGYINPQTVLMGMDVFRPPSVFSYFSPSGTAPGTGGLRGPEFGLLSTSTALRRLNFVNTMVFSTIAVSANSPAGTSLDLSAMQALAGNPAQLVEALNTLLLHGTMSPAMRDSIVGAVTAVAATNPLKRARTAVYLVATSSQYQVER